MNPTTQPALSRFHRRIEEKTANNGLPSVLILALGDSVTAGAGREDHFLQDDVYHTVLRRLLEDRYPLCNFSTINAGDGGQNAPGGVGKLELVLHHQPDLLLIAFGLNDCGRGEEGLEPFADALQAMIDRAREATEADIILLTPNMMPHHDNDAVPDKWRHVIEPFVQIQTSGMLKKYAERIAEVGRQNGVPVADVYAKWEELEARGVDTTAMLANGLNHPDAAGHKLAAETIMDVIESLRTA